MPSSLHKIQNPSEWDYGEDEAGIVYCLGRRVDEHRFEGIAVYIRSKANTGVKSSLDRDASYERFMYHGLPEESDKLEGLDPSARRSLTDHLLAADQCLYVDPRRLALADQRFGDIRTWLENHDPRVKQFNASLELACLTLDEAGIPRQRARVYGGAAFGVVNATSKVVDDIDLIIQASSRELYEYVERYQIPFTWLELDPDHRLSERRLRLKAKRWATSQIRLTKPYGLSIDLKTSRRPGDRTLWEQLPPSFDGERVTMKLLVTDDSEVFCISPAIRCADEAGQERIVLMRGYSYVGCATVGDTIEVSGMLVTGTSIILITQILEDVVVPDLRSVPVS